MKKFYKLFGIIVLVTIIGFSFSACDNGSTGNNNGDWPGRTLTITGLEAYEGKWAHISFQGHAFTEGGVEITLSGVEADLLIPSEGTVTTDIWVWVEDGAANAIMNDNYAAHAYKGSYNNAVFELAILDNEDDVVYPVDYITQSAVADFSAGNATYAFVAD